MRFGRRKEAKRAEQEQFRARRRYLREDVTVFWAQLSELHVDTLAAEDVAALEPVITALVDGRYETACVLAVAEGEPLPSRLPECFFNPQHGPSSIEVLWTPPGGTERSVAVCRSDARRLAAGEEPAVRMVRVGDRWVPFYFDDDSTSYFPPMIDSRALREGMRDGQAMAAKYGALPNPVIDSGGYGGGMGI